MCSAVMMVKAIANARVCVVAAERGIESRPEHPLEERGDRRLADPAQTETGHRDAELRRGDVLVGRVERAAYRSRHPAALGQQLIDAGLADRNNRELRGHEKTVGQDQREYRGQADTDVQDGVVHSRTSATILTLFCC